MILPGHVITGAAIGVVALPKKLPIWQGAIYFSIFTFLSVLPDNQYLPNWGHGNHYYYSHSLFVNLLVISIIAVIVISLGSLLNKPVSLTVILGGAVAWLSHLLLDAMYNTGYGIAIFWPFSEGRLILSIPWLALGHGVGLLTPEGLRLFTIEAITFLPLLVIAITARWLISHRTERVGQFSIG
jgi:membrane-bound metal-dependent hydrolase YbcI (DUF457 family)